MAFRRCNGIVVHHEVAGDPGLPAMAFANSLGTDLRVWDALLPRFAGRFRLIRYDKRGHGLSDLGTEPFTIALLADDLAALLDGLRVGRAVVVGLSIGGMIAQHLAAARPDLVRALVLMDTAHRIGTAETWRAWIEAVEAGGIAGIADAILERWFAAGFRATRPDELAGWRNMLTRTPKEGYVGCCAALRDADLTAATRALRVPTLCLVGEEDGATPPALVGELAGLIEGAGFRAVPEAGHLPCVERPEAVAAALDDFIRGRGVA
jgi:3-oxoadipate enol-lactonase